MLNRRSMIGLLVCVSTVGFHLPARAAEADNWSEVCTNVRRAYHLSKNFRNALLEELSQLSPTTRQTRLAQLGL